MEREEMVSAISVEEQGGDGAGGRDGGTGRRWQGWPGMPSDAQKLLMQSSL
jgi:hypothetical protein